MTEVDPELIRLVKKAKVDRKSSLYQYRERSEIAFIVHSFNREANIGQIVSGLRCIRNHELIVCDDGSIDNSRKKWKSNLNRPNDFLIFSNDLHEIRILDRAIRLASADIICIVQDDDTIPRETDWVDLALEKFGEHPRLAIIGGFMGFHGFDPDPGKVQCVWEEAPFRFVDHVNIGPYFIRKKYYQALGGWDFTFSGVGEPAICFDNEFCLRAWVNGYQVGYRFVPFKGPAGSYSEDGGTAIFSREIRRRNQIQNQRKIYDTYNKFGTKITELVRTANRNIGLSHD